MYFTPWGVVASFAWISALNLLALQLFNYWILSLFGIVKLLLFLSALPCVNHIIDLALIDLSGPRGHSVGGKFKHVQLDFLYWKSKVTCGSRWLSKVWKLSVYAIPVIGLKAHVEWQAVKKKINCCNFGIVSWCQRATHSMNIIGLNLIQSGELE